MSRTDLKTPWYYILLTLAGGHRHGLAISREVATLSGGRVRLWPAALYGAIEALNERGWIEEIDAKHRRPEDASERKRVYGLTPSGRVAVNAETRRLEDLVRIARAIEKADRKGHA